MIFNEKFIRSQAQTMQIQGNSGSMAKTIQGPYRVLPGRLSVIIKC